MDEIPKKMGKVEFDVRTITYLVQDPVVQFLPIFPCFSMAKSRCPILFATEPGRIFNQSW